MEQKLERQQKLFAYLKHCEDPNRYLHHHSDQYWAEDEPNYEYRNWIEEMKLLEHYYEEAVYSAINYDEVDEYLRENPMPIEGRTKELFDRELAIQEWYEDHGIDSTVYEKFTNCDLEDRERYIWWYEKNERGYRDEKKDFLVTEQAKMNKLSKVLTKSNKRKQKLERKLKPWLS